MPGPAPKHIDELAPGGTQRRYRSQTEPNDAVAAPPMPPGLPAGAQQHWRYIVPRLMERRTLAELDVGMLTMLCVEWDQYSRAVAELEGASPSERSRVRGRMATAFKNYMAAADRFGLSPVAKRRVAVTRERSVGDKGRFFADATPMKIAE